MVHIGRPHASLPYTSGGGDGSGLSSVQDDTHPVLGGNLNANSHTITGLAAAVNGGDAVNLTGLTAAIGTAISDLVDGAPTALDTLRELADALSDQTDALTAVLTALDGKVGTSDVRLTDARTPTDGSVTDAKVASNAAIAVTKLGTGRVTGADSSGAHSFVVKKISETDYQALVTAGTRDANTVYLRTA